MTLAEKIVLLRTRRGISQEGLAAELGVSRQTIGKWETGQALPELNGLIALSTFFSVAIDALVKESACSLLPEPHPEADSLLSFLIRAKRSTYAGYGMEADPCRPDAHDFLYAEPLFTYRDSYFGGHVFHGQETVWQKDQAVWCMNYSGRTLSEQFSGDFLKLALRSCTESMPYRGPEFFRNGEYTYVCRVDGDFDWFSGDESVFHTDLLVYECRFHGGYIR